MNLLSSIKSKNGQLIYTSLKQAFNTCQIDKTQLASIKSFAQSQSTEFKTFLDSLVDYLQLLYAGKDPTTLYPLFDALFLLLTPLFHIDWIKYIVKEFSCYLFNLAVNADKYKQQITNKHSIYYQLKARSRFDTLQNRLMNDRLENNQASKSCMFILVNWNLRTLFSLKELSLGPKVIQQTELQIERPESLAYFSIAQKVIYNYYTGKLHLFNHEFADADKHLTFAFIHCPKSHIKHKRMVRGSYPQITLLKKYQLADQFGPLILYQTSGNFNAYHAHLLKHQPFFLAINCYSILKYRTELLILRNLFFQGLRMMNEVKVTCEFLFQLCKFAQIPEWTIACIEDVESTVVSMIDEGLIKGYLVHGTKQLVMSKVEALPNPYTVFTSKYGLPTISAY